MATEPDFAAATCRFRQVRSATARRMTVAALVTLVLALQAWRVEAVETLRVLFIGNSLTIYNDLPWIVAALSESHGLRIVAGMVAFPGVALEDHWTEGGARREIASGAWDVVIMQQGPSALPASRGNLIQWATRFADEIRASGARPALWTVWPPGSRRADFADVIRSYRDAAEACRCELLPAGEAWHEARQASRGVMLYGPDGFHPSEEGSYLAALVIWAGLTGGDVATAPARLELAGGRRLEIPARRADVYRRAAASALSAPARPAAGGLGPAVEAAPPPMAFFYSVPRIQLR